MLLTRAGMCALGLLLCFSSFAQERPPSRAQPRSGFEFLGSDVKAMQEDDFSNPGMFWVERGAKLWSERAGAAGVSCECCHGDAAASMKGVAARYPAVDRETGRLMTLQGRILHCRS